MVNKIILFVAVLSYSAVVSQSFMYILALKNTQLALGGSSYTEVRQLIDANMTAYFKYVIYSVLLANLALVIVNFKSPASLSFITALIAFLALIIDTTLTLKGNVPLNSIIDAWSPQNYPNNWQEIREQWLSIFQYRQVANILGFVSLLIGAVFGQK